MTIDEKDKFEFIKYRLDEAKDTIEDVQLLISNDRLRASINRIYYGMFYSLLALGLKFKNVLIPILIFFRIFQASGQSSLL